MVLATKCKVNSEEKFPCEKLPMARKKNFVASTPFATTLLRGIWQGNYFRAKSFSDEIRYFSDKIDSSLKPIFVVVKQILPTSQIQSPTLGTQLFKGTKRFYTLFPQLPLISPNQYNYFFDEQGFSATPVGAALWAAPHVSVVGPLGVELDKLAKLRSIYMQYSLSIEFMTTLTHGDLAFCYNTN